MCFFFFELYSMLRTQFDPRAETESPSLWTSFDTSEIMRSDTPYRVMRKKTAAAAKREVLQFPAGFESVNRRASPCTRTAGSMLRAQRRVRSMGATDMPWWNADFEEEQLDRTTRNDIADEISTQWHRPVPHLPFSVSTAFSSGGDSASKSKNAHYSM